MRMMSMAICVAICGCATEPTTAGQARVIADITRPTDDGLASYRFEFVELDGAIATTIASPVGYPVFDPVGCALDTFLRVAPDTAEVPIELRRACEGADVASGPPVRVAELRPTGAALQSQVQSATGPYCSGASFDTRLQKIEDAVAFQATEAIGELVCDVGIFAGCTLYNLHTGQFIGLCDPLQGPPIGGPPDCWAWHTEYHNVPNPACDHPIWTGGSYGPWLDWENVTPFDVSRLRFEVSACSNDTTVVYWQMRRSSDDPYSDPKYYIYNTAVYVTLTLDAGTSNGDWSGARFLLHANGNGVHPMIAGARMKGIDRSDCPIGL